MEGNIAFKGLSFRYPTRPESLVFDQLSFQVAAGEHVAIVGASGSGKSSLAQLLLRFYNVEDGEIEIDGHNIQELNIEWLRSHIGYVSQGPILFAGTILENIKYGNPDATMEQIIQVCDMANALEFIEKFPNKFETYVGERGLSLSGGQKQRIAIARALLKNPKIMILDEATSALDGASEMLVQKALDNVVKGRTVITIAHRQSTVEKANRVVVIGHGKVQESGSFEELLAREGSILRRLFEE